MTKLYLRNQNHTTSKHADNVHLAALFNIRENMAQKQAKKRHTTKGSRSSTMSFQDT